MSEKPQYLVIVIAMKPGPVLQFDSGQQESSDPFLLYSMLTSQLGSQVHGVIQEPLMQFVSFVRPASPVISMQVR